jgi:hypothetical protein
MKTAFDLGWEVMCAQMKARRAEAEAEGAALCHLVLYRLLRGGKSRDHAWSLLYARRRGSYDVMLNCLLKEEEVKVVRKGALGRWRLFSAQIARAWHERMTMCLSKGGYPCLLCSLTVVGS